MNVTQGFMALIAIFVVAVVVVVNHYRKFDLLERNRDLERKVEIYESLSPVEFAAIQESAATTMEEETDFLQLTKEKLSIDNLYDVCLANYRLLTTEQRLLLRSVDNKTEQETIAAVLNVLEENGIIDIKEDGVYLTIRYALSLHMQQLNKLPLKKKEA